MSDVKTDQAFFCVIQKEGSQLPSGIKFGSEVEKLALWADGTTEGADEAAPQTQSSEPDSEAAAPLEVLMNRVADSGHQQTEMLAILDAVRTVFPMTVIKSDIVDKFAAPYKVVSKSKDYNIFKVDGDDLSKIIHALNRVFRIQSGLDQVPAAILLSIVSTFDSQMSDVVRVMLGIKSDRLRSGQKKIPLSEIMAASCLEDVIAEAVNDEVYQFSRGSHDEQIKYIEDNFSISIRENWKRWPDLIEVFERRNLVAHGEAKFTSRYASICGKHAYKGSDKLVGSPVILNFKYLGQSLDILSEFAILTIFSLWRKHVKDSDSHAFSALNEVTFKLIDGERYYVAIRVTEYALNLKNTVVKEATRLRLVVNLASAQLHAKLKEAAYKTLDKEDWSASSDDFKICVAALREDIDEVIRILPLVKAADSIPSSGFNEWPVFDFIRNKVEFANSFREVFGEELTSLAEESVFSAEAGSVSADIKTDDVEPSIESAASSDIVDSTLH